MVGGLARDRPLDNTEGASGEVLLQIEIAEDRLAAFEWVEERANHTENGWRRRPCSTMPAQ